MAARQWTPPLWPRAYTHKVAGACSGGCRRGLVGLQARLGDDLPRGRIEEQAATPLGATPDLLAQRQQAPDEVVQAHHDPMLRRCGLDIAHLTHRVAASDTRGCGV